MANKQPAIYARRGERFTRDSFGISFKEIQARALNKEAKEEIAPRVARGEGVGLDRTGGGRDGILLRRGY